MSTFAKTKYVVLRGQFEDYPVVFPNYVNHSTFQHMGPVSAGFIGINEDGVIRTFGESFSLGGLKSRPEDAQLIQEMLAAD